LEKKLFFGGTAYLNIPFNKTFKDLVVDGMDLYGINFGASRNNNVTIDIFSQAEAEAARRCGAEDAIIVSSGYLSAQLVVQHHLHHYSFVYAPETHPALWIGQPQPPQNTFNEWAEQAVEKVNCSDRPVLLITNSLNNLYPEIYDFEWLAKILPGRKVRLLVDDSHGIGITGESGRGVYTRIPKCPDIEHIVIASMAKGLGIDAGVILSSRTIVDELRDSPIYAGASPPSPAILYAYLKGQSIYEEELVKLRENMKFFSSFIENQVKLAHVADFPVYLISNADAGRYLFEKGIHISSFAYPDPKSVALNRVVLNSGHTKEQMRRLVEAIVTINER
jgi:7-keto-8-aminopelargonate synthetase-like enzyme